MSVDTRIVSTEALNFGMSDSTTVKNLGPGTLSYGTTSACSDGTLAVSSSTSFSSPRWLMANVATLVQLEYAEPGDEETAADVAALEVRVDAHDVDIAVVGETLQIDTTATASAQTSELNTAIDNIDSQGGGLVRVGGTQGTPISVDDPIIVHRDIALQGQGKRETEFEATTADACIWWNEGEVTDKRGGESGGFTFNGNQLATSCIRLDGVNRSYRDIKVTSPANSGIMYEVGTVGSTDGGQNLSLTNIEGDNEDSSTGVVGILIDNSSAGINLSDTQFTKCDTVLVTDNSDTGFATDGPKNITVKGFMWERGLSASAPLIHIKAGRNISFRGGNLAHTFITPSAEYDIVLIDKTNSAGRTTKAISFDGVYFQGALGPPPSLPSAPTTPYANAVNLASDMTADGAWVSVKNSTFQNVLNGYAIGSGQGQLVARDCDYTGVSSVYRTGSSGKPNTIIRSSANNLPTRAVCDYYEISGTTTINNFTATYPGHRIFAKFAASLTVSSSAGNIKLSGLSDMSATADDVLALVCDGVDWHEIGRVVK